MQTCTEGTCRTAHRQASRAGTTLTGPGGVVIEYTCNYLVRVFAVNEDYIKKVIN